MTENLKFNFADTTLRLADNIFGNISDSLSLSAEQIAMFANVICPGNEDFWDAFQDFFGTRVFKNLRAFGSNISRLYDAENFRRGTGIRATRLQIALLFKKSLAEAISQSKFKNPTILSVFGKRQQSAARLTIQNNRGSKIIPWHELVSLKGFQASEHDFILDGNSEIAFLGNLINNILAIPAPTGSLFNKNNIRGIINTREEYPLLKEILQDLRAKNIHANEFQAIKIELRSRIEDIGLKNF